MDIRFTLLQEENTLVQIKEMAKYIGSDASKFAQIMELFFSKEPRVAQRAAWAFGHCTDAYPQLAIPYLKDMVHSLRQPAPDAVKRNILRLLQRIDTPSALWGDLVDICYDFLLDKKKPVAIRVFAMTVLSQIAHQLPELGEELKTVVEELLPYGSPGLLNRGRKVLKVLEKLPSGPLRRG